MSAKAEDIVKTLQSAGTDPFKLQRAMPVVLEGFGDLVSRLQACEQHIGIGQVPRTAAPLQSNHPTDPKK